VKVLRWLALSIPFIVLAEVLAAASRGLGDNWVKIICVDLARSVAIVVALGALLIAGTTSLPAVAIVHLAAAAAAAVLTVSAFRLGSRWGARAEGAMMGSLLRYSLPLLMTGLTAWPSAVIPLTLGAMVSPIAVTYFNLGGALANFIYMPVNAVDFALFPVWMRYLREGSRTEIARLYAYTTRWCFVLGSTIFVFLFFGATSILTLLYGPNYAAAAPVVRWIAVAVLANAVTGTNASLLRAFGHTREIFLATAAGGLVAIGGIYPFIKWGGLTGGLIVFVAAQVAGIALYSIFLFTRERLHPLDRSYMKTLLVIALSFGAVWKAAPSVPEGFAGSVVLLGLYLVLVFLGLSVLRVFEAQDLYLIGRAWARVTGDGR
jgi:O-antigen/teichoic acid export membrane protein